MNVLQASQDYQTCWAQQQSQWSSGHWKLLLTAHKHSSNPGQHYGFCHTTEGPHGPQDQNRVKEFSYTPYVYSLGFIYFQSRYFINHTSTNLWTNKIMRWKVFQNLKSLNRSWCKSCFESVKIWLGKNIGKYSEP